MPGFVNKVSFILISNPQHQALTEFYIKLISRFVNLQHALSQLAMEHAHMKMLYRHGFLLLSTKNFVIILGTTRIILCYSMTFLYYRGPKQHYNDTLERLYKVNCIRLLNLIANEPFGYDNLGKT